MVILVSEWEEVSEVVFGMNNLILIIKCFVFDLDMFIECVLKSWFKFGIVVSEGCMVEILVVYGGSVGFDLDNVVCYIGLLIKEVIECYSSVEYVVYFLGFLFGFVYMGGFDVSLVMLCYIMLWVSILVGLVGIGGE